MCYGIARLMKRGILHHLLAAVLSVVLVADPSLTAFTGNSFPTFQRPPIPSQFTGQALSVQPLFFLWYDIPKFSARMKEFVARGPFGWTSGEYIALSIILVLTVASLVFIR